MSLNNVPASGRVHIGFFGARNAGKSSLVNAVTGQEISIVSDVRGTTTDPVTKAMELPKLGPAVIIDTPGFDDEGNLGELRVARTRKVLNKIDAAVLVVDASVGMGMPETELIELFVAKTIPYVVVFNKSDLLGMEKLRELSATENAILLSAKNKDNISALLDRLAVIVEEGQEKHLVADLVEEKSLVLLVVPIDSSAPKDRLILPQQMVIRDLLEKNVRVGVVRDTELRETLDELAVRPALVITDSQVFSKVKDIVPEDVMLTSFSILMARYRGFIAEAVRGAYALDADGADNILICEGCTHHRQCDDIGSVKLPAWIESYKNKKCSFTFTTGGDFPEELGQYSLIIHCGGCMLNDRELIYRMKCAKDAGIPFTNCGTVIAHINGILKRSVEILKIT